MDSVSCWEIEKSVFEMIDTLCEADPTSMELRKCCSVPLVIRQKDESVVEYNIACNNTRSLKFYPPPPHAGAIFFTDFNELIKTYKNPKLLEKNKSSENNQAIKPVVQLFDRLSSLVYLGGTKLGDEVLYKTSVRMAMSLGNYEEESKALASRVADGLLQISIRDDPSLEMNILCKNHQFKFGVHAQPIRSRIEYSDVSTAAGVLNRTRNPFLLTVHEEYVVRGFIPMIDAFEKLLFRSNAFLTDGN